MSWFSNIGKLLLIGAGLVAWLDVSGPAKVKDWAERAEKRHDETTKRWSQLGAARSDQDLVRRTARWAAFTLPDAPSAGAGQIEQPADEALAAEDFQVFRQAAWKSREESPRYAKSPNKYDPRFAFPFMEEQAYKFLIERLPAPRGAKLDYAYQEILDRERRWEWIRNTSALAIWPATGLLSWWFHTGGTSWLPSIFIAFMSVGFAGFGASAALLTPRFIIAVLRLAAAVRLGLARAAVRAMGEEKDGRPLRKAALGIFIVGSLLDLIGGWSKLPEA